MTPMRWMVSLSVASWLILVGIVGLDFLPELTAGMVGPLAVVAASWTIIARAHKFGPARVQQALLSAFIVKALFFALYVVTMVELVGVRTVPFAVCFAGYFIGLYAMQALWMRRLFISSTQVSA